MATEGYAATTTQNFNVFRSLSTIFKLKLPFCRRQFLINSPSSKATHKNRALCEKKAGCVRQNLGREIHTRARTENIVDETLWNYLKLNNFVVSKCSSGKIVQQMTLLVCLFPRHIWLNSVIDRKTVIIVLLKRAFLQSPTDEYMLIISLAFSHCNQ